MSPRKSVLLYCSDETRLGMACFVLQSRSRYAITPCYAVDQVASALGCEIFHAAIVMDSISDHDHGELIVRLVKRSQSQCIVVLDLLGGTGSPWAERLVPNLPFGSAPAGTAWIGVEKPSVVTTVADRIVSPHTMATLLEALDIACRRHRGPQKAVEMLPRSRDREDASVSRALMTPEEKALDDVWKDKLALLDAAYEQSRFAGRAIRDALEAVQLAQSNFLTLVERNAEAVAEMEGAE